MHTNNLPKIYKFIFASLIFLFLGLTTSPTGVAGYHILVFIPAIILWNNYRFSLSKSSITLLVLLVWGLVSSVVNLETLIKPEKAFQDVKYYGFGVLCISAIYFFISFKRKKHIRILLNILLGTIIVGFFVGISKAYFSFDPVKWKFGEYHIRSGGFNNYMRYGYSSAFMLLLGIGAYFNFSKIKEFVSLNWLRFFIFFNFMAIITSQTRGAVLGMLIGLPFLLLRYKPKLGKVLYGFGFIGILAIGIFSVSKQSENRVININDGSNRVRLSQFYSAVMAIKDNPVFGLGADQFSYNVKEIKSKYNIWAEDYSGHAHNILLEHGANYGIPGMLLFLGFLLLWFVEMIKLNSDFGWIIASYILAYTASGQVELVLDVINSHLVFFIYSISQVMIIIKNEKDKV